MNLDLAFWVFLGRILIQNKQNKDKSHTENLPKEFQGMSFYYNLLRYYIAGCLFNGLTDFTSFVVENSIIACTYSFF